MEIIIGKTAGFCYGVRRAVEGAKKELNERKELYCLGDIVHNKHVLQRLEDSGMKVIETLEEAKTETIIRAHGVTKQIYNKAKELNIKLKDLTCPSVLKIHKIAKEYANKDYFIILTGEAKHPEIIGTASFCGESYQIIENEEEIEKVLKQINKKNILLISQTTFNSKKFDNIEKKLRQLADDRINLEVKKTICNATEIRQKETEEIAKQVELMIIIGGKKSSNTNKLYEISCKNCNHVIFIEGEEDLNLDDIKNANKIGIMAGASTDNEDIIKVKNKILMGGK